jgi:hypothetical protein
MASLIEFCRGTQCVTTIRGKKISDDEGQAKSKLVFFVMSGTVEVHGSDGAPSALQGAGTFWGLSSVLAELPSDGVVTAHSSNVELLRVSAKVLLQKVDEQTLRHMVEVTGFAYERTKLRSQRSQRTINSAGSTAGRSASSAAVMDAEVEEVPDSGVFSAEYGSSASRAAAMDVCSQVISRATAAESRKQLSPTPSGWLPLRVDQNPRPSLRRVWAAEDPARGIAIHMDELITLLDSNESLLAQLSGESCVAILSALGAVNKMLDAAGLWRGHSSAQDARRQLETEAELSQLTGQAKGYDSTMGRLQLEVLLKLTSARIAHLAEQTEAEISSGSDTSLANEQLDLDMVHAKISECLDCAHRQLLDTPAMGGDGSPGAPPSGPSEFDTGFTSSSITPGPVPLEVDTAANGASTKHLKGKNMDNTGTICRIGGVLVPFASGRWVWLSRSRSSVFPYGEEENTVIEEAFAKYSGRFKPVVDEQEPWDEQDGGIGRATDDDVRDNRTVMLPGETHFIDFEQMREIRCDSHELFKEVKRLRAGIDRFEP